MGAVAPLTCVGMECHACGRHVEAIDRFCNGCGASLVETTDGATQSASAADPDNRTVPDEADAATTAPDANSSLDSDAPSDPSDDGERTEAIPVAAAATPVEAPVEDQRTELIEVTEGEEWEDDPAWARTGSVPEQPADLATGDLAATEPITEVWMQSVPSDTDPPAATPYDFAEREPVAITGQFDAQPAATAQMPAVTTVALPEAPRRFRFGLITLIAIVTGVVSLGALFTDVIVISSNVRLVATDDTPATFRTGTWIADDLADNLSIAGLIAIVLIVAGGVASGYQWRWGSGLAGGAGLALAGLAALTVGLAQFPIDVARQFARIPTDNPFVLTITRDLGYWLLVVAGALGVVLFFASINDAIGDRRAGLNPWIAALGALAVVVASAGPLIQENQAVFSDNWYLVDAPGEPSALLLVGRLVQLGLLLMGGVIGFLSVRRWGLGVAIGATLPAVWLTLSTLLELGDEPVGPGFRNPGATDMHVHGVTIIGMSAVLAMLVLAVVGAYDQDARRRP